MVNGSKNQPLAKAAGALLRMSTETAQVQRVGAPGHDHDRQPLFSKELGSETDKGRGQKEADPLRGINTFHRADVLPCPSGSVVKLPLAWGTYWDIQA